MKIIDIHTHGGYGINYNSADEAQTRELLKKLLNRGIVGVCPTLVGDTQEAIRKRLELFKKIKAEQNKDEARILGIHLEGSFINPNKPGIQDPSVFIKPTIENFKKLVGEYEDIIKIVTVATELDDKSKLTKYLEKKGIRVHCGHTLSDNWGLATGLTHHFNAMEKISHRGENIALKGLLDKKIYSEIISDGIHVSDDMLRLFFKVKAKSRIILISDSLPSAGYDKDIVFCSKKINKFGKNKDGVLAGSIKFLDEIVKMSIKKGLFNSEEAKKYAYHNPIRHLNLDKKDVEFMDNLP